MALSSPIQSQQIMKTLEIVGEIFQENNIKICVKESAKGGFIAGVSTLVGGLLGGKPGVLVGGVLGTIAAYTMAPDYKSLLQVINEMDYDLQKKLFDTIQKTVSSIDISDVVKFAILLTTSQSIKSAVICEVINFIGNELSLETTRS